jgi:hypothetical protein
MREQNQTINSFFPTLLSQRKKHVFIGLTRETITAIYCSISFKSTLGVMRDPKNHFDISTTAKIWRDTSEIFDIGTKIWAFSRPTVNFEHCVTLGRFDNRRRDA